MAIGNGLSASSSRVRLRFAPDDRLATFVQRGDRAAFETLYERHSAELLSFCTYMLGSRHDAEDALQMTFVAAYRALLANRSPVALRPWLFAIARNDCLNILRKRRPTCELNGEVALTGDPVRALELKDEVTQAVKSILDLPERQRAAIVLAEMHGMSHAEIGGVLGARAEQVKAYVFQARSRLNSARSARTADCEEIREELASAHGGTLLRRRLRGHVRTCAGCRAYAEGVARQRRQLGALVPWVPTLWLKARVLEHALAFRSAPPPYARGAAAGGSLAGAAAEVAGGGAKGLLVKLAGGAACLGASACVGVSVLGGSILPGEGRASSAPGTSLARPRAASSVGAYSRQLASAVAPARARSRVRPERPRGASATPEAGVSYAPGAVPRAGTGAADTLPAGTSVRADGDARSAGEAHGLGSEQRGERGQERRHQSEARRHQSAERRTAGSTRPPKPSKQERQRERETRPEEIGLSGPPRKTRQERLKLREERRRQPQ